MCIAIVIPSGVQVPDAVIDTCAKRNPHGAGIAYIGKSPKTGKNLVIVRKYASAEGDNLNKLKMAYRKAIEKHGADEHYMLMHFRYRTSGPVSRDNSHPFSFQHGAMMHNGHLFTSDDKEKSDTRIFIEKYGKELTEDFLSLCSIDIEKTVLGSDRIAFLFPTGNVVVLNRKMWHEGPDGTLFSNGGWKR